MFTNFKTIATVGLLASASIFTTTAVADSNNPNKHVGTYYTDGGAMVTLHAKGTLDHVVDDSFSRDDRGATPALGVWKKSGTNEIKVTWVRFLTEQGGDEFSPNGMISRVSYTMQFEEAVDGKSPGYIVDGVTVENFQPGQNPVTDEPIQAFDAPTFTTGYRLELQ